MTSEFTRAYARHESARCNLCGKPSRAPGYELCMDCLTGPCVAPYRKPTNAERAAWFRENDTSVPEQVERVGLTARLAYFLLFGVVRPVCEAFAWAEEKLKEKRK